MAEPTERNPYAPPQAPVDDTPPPMAEPGALASRMVRLGGSIADGIASSVIVFPILFSTGLWNKLLSDEVSFATTLAVSAGGFLFTAMNGYLLAKRGQTLGKWLVGTRIVRADNDEVPTLARTLGLRYGALAIGLPSTLLVLVVNGVIPYALIVVGLIDIVPIFRRDRRCLHDLIAGTKVIYVEPPRAAVETGSRLRAS